ncbi:MAG: PD-(D/E)XK nuclease family protein [Alteromonas sp.]|nr:PD-(D/E)XK nuclease family protein [Alteromonas sp.]
MGIKQEPPAHLKINTKTIKVWSHSSLKNFERCRLAAKFKHIDKIKVEMKSKGQIAADRGSKIHDEAEHFVRGDFGDKLPTALKDFKKGFLDLQEKFTRGIVELEEDWGIRKDWSSCTWRDKDLWGRIKLDVMVHESETSAVVIDHKTGRKFGNEIKHGDQGMTYVIAAFERYPKLQFVTCEFWYLDQKGEKLIQRYTRNQAMVLKKRLTARAVEMTSAISFPAEPSKENCKWCDFKEEHCEWAYDE